MKKVSEKNKIRKDLKQIYQSMDFVSKHFKKTKHKQKVDIKKYYTIYQQLGLAWEFLGLQCQHWDGYKKAKEGIKTCKICGKVKGVDDIYYLLPKHGPKILGTGLKPNSKKIFKNKKAATILNDSINFFGATLSIDIHNAYKSKLGKGKYKINMADERIVRLEERGIECYLDNHLIHIKLNNEMTKTVPITGVFPIPPQSALWPLRSV